MVCTAGSSAPTACCTPAVRNRDMKQHWFCSGTHHSTRENWSVSAAYLPRTVAENCDSGIARAVRHEFGWVKGFLVVAVIRLRIKNIIVQVTVFGSFQRIFAGSYLSAHEDEFT